LQREALLLPELFQLRPDGADNPVDMLFDTKSALGLRIGLVISSLPLTVYGV
jgi:hypothetical protein